MRELAVTKTVDHQEQIVPGVGKAAGQVGLQTSTRRPAGEAGFHLGGEIHKAGSVIGRQRVNSNRPGPVLPESHAGGGRDCRAG